jgi:hypothetical protein
MCHLKDVDSARPGKACTTAKLSRTFNVKLLWMLQGRDSGRHFLGYVWEICDQWRLEKCRAQCWFYQSYEWSTLTRGSCISCLWKQLVSWSWSNRHEPLVTQTSKPEVQFFWPPHLTSEFGAPRLIADSYIRHELHTTTHPPRPRLTQ